MTFDDLMKEVEKKETLTKEASAGAGANNVETLLRGLTSRMEKNASQERTMKYAHDAGNEFAKGAAEKFAAAAQTFVDIVDTEEFAEKIANLVIEKLAIETSGQTIHSLSEGVPEEDPRDATEKDQLGQNLAEPNKMEAKKQQKIDARVVEGADAEGQGKLLAEKKAARDVLSELLELVSEDE